MAGPRELDEHTAIAQRADAAVPASSDAPVGRYIVIEVLGAGGFGVVRRAYDPKLGREVALKYLEGTGLSPTTELHLLREAQAMAKLNHPNVVTVYDVELDGGQVVLAMEYVRGVTLRQWLMAAYVAGGGRSVRGGRQGSGSRA